MSSLSVNAGVQEIETGSLIGQSYSVQTVSDLTNRETHVVVQASEVQFLFTPVQTGKASILVIRYASVVDSGTSDTATLATWGYATDPTGATHEHQLVLGETNIVRLNPTKAASSIFIACEAGTTDINVEVQVWDE